MTTPNARFWTYINGGPVKLTLHPGQRLTWGKWERTDEGWSSEAYTWTHEEQWVSLQWCDDGVDCDGRMRRGGKSFVPLTSLHAGNTMDGITYPAWREKDSWQRDYQAEAAGY